MKRFVGAASIAAGMWLGLSAPAGAIVVIGGAETTLGGPDTRLGVEVGMEPCISGGTAFLPCIAAGGMNPCIADGLFQPCVADVTVGVRVDSAGRS